jgi:ATP-binding cassette subfamily F protein 3
MLLLSCTELARAFDTPVFRDIGFELRAGERVGLVGPNGAGKTTLLKVLAGLDSPDEGEVRLHAGARAGLLKQQVELSGGKSVFEEAQSALDELVRAHDDMVATAQALAVATDPTQRAALTARYDRLNELLRHHDAYNLDHRIEMILEGIGFRSQDFHRDARTLSGGQQSRLMLAKLLLAAPDVLLLDEPSNHLDIAGTRWLEDYLSKQNEAMLIVSHDRYFLDKVVSKVFELANGRLEVYPGNYAAYTRLRQERYDFQLKSWQAQQEHIAEQEEYIRRVHYGQLHKQAHSRQKALDRLERIERPRAIEMPRMHFGQVRRAGDMVFDIEGIAKTYDRPLFSDLNFTIERGRRLGILGPNGCGKTTLLRVIMGQEQPDRGRVQRGAQVDIGYYDQHLALLADDARVSEAVRAGFDAGVSEQSIRDLLGRFGLSKDQVNQRVGELSGGERSRAALAKLVASGANVLVLDEPTNHLDLWAREALEDALAGYEGTVIVVSHDRYFLNRAVDQLVVFEAPGRTVIVHGNYDTYERMAALQAPFVPAPTARPVRPVSAKPAGTRPKRRFPYRKVEHLEREITKCESHLRELEQLMADPDLYRDGERVKSVTKDFETSKAELARLYEHWEEAVELN